LIVAPVQERLGIEMLVSPVVIKDRDAPLVVNPVVVGNDIIGRVPQLDLSRQNWDSQGGTMVNELGALMGVGRVCGVAQRVTGNRV